MAAAYILFFLLLIFLAWGLVRLSIWILKTAIKEALREYEEEKGQGQKPYGPQ